MITGKVRDCTVDGIYVSLGFFEDVIIPASELQNPSYFQQDLWVWKYSEFEEAGSLTSITRSVVCDTKYRSQVIYGWTREPSFDFELPKSDSISPHDRRSSKRNPTLRHSKLRGRDKHKHRVRDKLRHLHPTMVLTPAHRTKVIGEANSTSQNQKKKRSENSHA